MKKPAKILSPRWEEIFASLGDGLIVIDEKKNLLAMNPSAEGITGLSAETILGYPIQEAFFNNQKLLDLLENSFKTGTALTLREVPWQKNRGEKGAIDLTTTPLTNEEGGLSGWILLFRDLSPMKSLEEQVRKSDRLAMMGTIAAGLAHEIKNPLGGIRGAAQLLKREHPSPTASEFLEVIIKEVDRVDRLVGQLLTFSKPKSLNLEPLNLNELLDSILTLQKGLFEQKKIKLEREFDPSLPPILGDADALRQVILNIIKNSVEAIPQSSGQISIRSRLTTNFRIKEVREKKPTRLVMTEIRDNGIGISKEDLEKIFTPFFTTKQSGVGLGMAIAQRVIDEHGGIIQFLSEKEKGTTVRLFLRSCL